MEIRSFSYLTIIFVFRFVKEIEYIFVEAMLFQFFVVSWVICMTVYKIVGVSSLFYLITETSLRVFCSSRYASALHSTG